MRSSGFRALWIAVVILWAGSMLAQQSNEAEPTYTLHVYADRIQIPTLILNGDLKPIRNLTREKLRVSLDQGPLFEPTHLRVEGDDPLTVAVLLDASGSQAELLRRFAEQFADLVPQSLHANDHVSLYATDCRLMRTLEDAPADADRIRAKLRTLLDSRDLHTPRTGHDCNDARTLYDAASRIGRQLSELPGRRVLLLVSDGHDSNSRLKLQELAEVLSVNAVTVFGVHDETEHGPEHLRAPPIVSMRQAATSSALADPLNFLCNRTGGLAFGATPATLAATLRQVVSLLRSRYIVEFPRPSNSTAGMHSIAITVPHSWSAIIHASGASAPLPDPAVLNDPTTVPSAPSPAVLGNQRPHQ